MAALWVRGIVDAIDVMRVESLVRSDDSENILIELTMSTSYSSEL